MLEDVEQRKDIINSQNAGLKRLSARANCRSIGRKVISSYAIDGCFSFSQLARTVIDTLKKLGVSIDPGMTEDEINRVEAPFAFNFPPDLRAILQEGLPIGPGFPDWRSAGNKQLRLTLSLPVAGLCYEVAAGRFWLKQWGPKPSDNQKAIHIARCALRRAPILVPVYRNCYIPASPNRTGNPIFFVLRDEVAYRGWDIFSFFHSFGIDSEFGNCTAIHGFRLNVETGVSQQLSKHCNAEKCAKMYRIMDDCGRKCKVPPKKTLSETKRRSFEIIPTKSKFSKDGLDLHQGTSKHHRVLRKIDFWSDLVKTKRYSDENVAPNELFTFSAECADSKTLVCDKAVVPSLPFWLVSYLDKIAIVLKDAGWKDTDVDEMLNLKYSPFEEGATLLSINTLGIIEGLVIFVNFLSDTLQKAGWSAKEVAESFDIDLSMGNSRKPSPSIPPHIAARVSKLCRTSW